MMGRAGRLLVAPAVIVVLAGLASPALAAPAINSGSEASAVASMLDGPGHYVHSDGNGRSDVNVCSDAVPAGSVHCDALIRTDLVGHNVQPDLSGGYSPAYLQSAYNAPSATNGTGQTVAIVDAYDDPTAESDLASYRTQFGLAPCTTANGCFRKVNETGGTSYPTPDSSWSEEISLDVDMVSALCPNCHILLVEASSTFTSDLGAGVNEAVALGANVVSNSYGGNEFAGETAADTAYYNHPGVAIVASSGDNGYGVEYPAASRDVVAVGGTSLVQLTATGARNGTETVWNGAGSGCSAYEPKPAWQTDTGCSTRMVADVSAEADPNTGVLVYTPAGWGVFGGTSAASPIVGAMYALADNGTSSAQMGSYPYAHTTALNDVVSGNNGSCSPTYFCTGVTGYDGPSGLGTPNTASAFGATGTAPPPAPPTPDFSLAATSLGSPLKPGASAKSTLTIAPLNSDTGVVTLSATTSPASGLATAIAPRTVTLGGTATTSALTLTARAGGTYTVTVVATQGALRHTAKLTVTVNDFVLRVAKPKAVLVRGKTIRYTVTIARRGAFAGTVKLTLKGLRVLDKMTYTSRGAGTPTITFTVTIKTSLKDRNGTLSLHFNGVSGTFHHSVVVLLVLR